jgi:hypothetical protein
MDPAIETASVMDAELRNRHDVVSAIEGRLEALAGSGVIWCKEVSVRSIEERVKVDHVARHVVPGGETRRFGVPRMWSRCVLAIFGQRRYQFR